MIRDDFADGEPVCWTDEDDVWHHGTVRRVVNGVLEVEDTTTETVDRIDAAGARTSAPTIPFKTSAHPKDPESRILLHAISDAIEEVGLAWDDVGLVWNGETPTVVFAKSVPESRINAVRLTVENRTPDDVVPKQRHCETLQP